MVNLINVFKSKAVLTSIVLIKKNSLVIFTLGMVSVLTGINTMLILFFCMGLIADMALGLYTNVVYLKKPFETDKFFNGVIKMLITFAIIPLVNMLALGLTRPDAQSTISKAVNFFIQSFKETIFIILGLVIILGIAENGAKLGIKFFVYITKLVKMRLNNAIDGSVIENEERVYIDNNNDDIQIIEDES